jgi:hypothetical protein
MRSRNGSLRHHISRLAAIRDLGVLPGRGTFSCSAAKDNLPAASAVAADARSERRSIVDMVINLQSAVVGIAGSNVMDSATRT